MNRLRCTSSGSAGEWKVKLAQRVARHAVIVSVEPMRVAVRTAGCDVEILGFFPSVEVATVAVRPVGVVSRGTVGWRSGRGGSGLVGW